MNHLYKCQNCLEYTFSTKCKCGGIAVPPQPPKYSPEDKYAKYRRETKRKELEEKGFLKPKQIL